MGKMVKKLETMHGRACGNCYHWERFPDKAQTPGEDIIGECWAEPPKVTGIDDDGAIIQSRPVVGFSERCGQHQHQVN